MYFFKMENKNQTAYTSTSLYFRKYLLNNSFWSKEFRITGAKLKNNGKLRIAFRNGLLGINKYTFAKSIVAMQFLEDLDVFDMYSRTFKSEKNPNSIRGKYIEVFFNKRTGKIAAVSPISEVSFNYKPVQDDINVGKINRGKLGKGLNDIIQSQERETNGQETKESKFLRDLLKNSKLYKDIQEHKQPED